MKEVVIVSGCRTAIGKHGGAFRDMGVHVLDAAWWIMGTPTPACVLGCGGAKFGPRGKGYWNFTTPTEDVYTQYEADDYAGGLVRFENGAALQVESFWASHQPGELQIELFGTEAGAQLRPLTIYKTVDGAPRDISVDVKEFEAGGPTAKGSMQPPKYLKSWDAVADHFIECILDDVQCLAPLRHGLVVQAMLEAVLESSETGNEVRIDVDAV